MGPEHFPFSDRFVLYAYTTTSKDLFYRHIPLNQKYCTLLTLCYCYWAVHIFTFLVPFFFTFSSSQYNIICWQFVKEIFHLGSIAESTVYDTNLYEQKR